LPGRELKTARMALMAKQKNSTEARSQPDESSKLSSGATEEQGMSSPLDLTDHFLIAMPAMLDPLFGGSVIYLCEHNANGALGVVINKPTDMTMSTLLERVDLTLEISPRLLPESDQKVMFGGPVQVERGFVLHTPNEQYTSTMRVTGDVALTTSKDVLEAVASGRGPEQIMVSLGCSGWSAGQLEEELVRNGWLTVKADPSIIFRMPVERRFTAALGLLGIDPVMLTAESGHA
jgi:putative transcriptional regulator